MSIASSSQHRQLNTTSELDDFEEFLKQGLPSRLEQDLRTRLARVLSPLEETLQDQIVDMIESFQLHVLQEYRASSAEKKPAPESQTMSQQSLQREDEPFRHRPSFFSPELTTSRMEGGDTLDFEEQDLEGYPPEFGLYDF